jgi:CO/xanthine dehydrogenase Mo-binding subunit/uncharacterized protein (UPF0261 family)
VTDSVLTKPAAMEERPAPLSGGEVGQPVLRYGGADRTTGAQRFLADLTFVGAAQVTLVTIPCGCADIVSVDTSAATSIPGVIAVLTADDLPDPMPRFGVSHQDRPVLAAGHVSYHGEPVAAVVAETLDQARDAARAVRVDYVELPGVYSLEAALAPDAHLVQHPDIRPGDSRNDSNVLDEALYTWGDTTAGEDDADVVIDEVYTFPMVTHFPIEPGGTVVVPTDQGGLDVYSPVQHPYLLQRTLASVLKLPLNKVRVFAPDPGGAFGGKQNPKHEPLIAFLALRTGRTCRLVLSLEETFQSMRRAGCHIRARTGFTSSGELTFHELRCDYLIGAYADVAPRVMSKGSYVGAGPYRIPAARIEARAVMTNTTPSTAFRGFGCPQVAWATESQMNEAARRLGLDALEIRRRNLVARGEAFVRGENAATADGEWSESLEKAAELIGWDEPLPPGRGRGIAVAIKPGATSGLSQSLVRLLCDGSAIVYAGTSDMGQGARTLWQQIVADELGAPLDQVTVVSGDTGTVPFDLQTSASRSTVFMGTAVMEACHDVRRRVLELYAEATDVPTEELSHRPAVLSTPDGDLRLVDAAKKALGSLRGEFIGQGTCRLRGRGNHPLGGDAAFYEFNCTAIEVEVDRETGELLLTKHVSVSDVGTELNPLQVVSQDEGASIMGLGHSQMEQLLVDDHGLIRNLGALDYRIPTFKDVPVELVTAAVENHDGPGPYGSKGISEGALLCTAGALGGAVSQAAGVVVRDLPLTPERVWAAIQASETDQSTETDPTPEEHSMGSNAVVCLAGTLDTKGTEYAFVKDCLEAAGVDVLVVDCGVLGEPYFAPDVPASTIAERAGVDLADFQGGVEGAGGRVLAITKMSEGLAGVIADLVEEGRIDAVLGLGGTGGTDLLSGAFKLLDIGFPKLIVSTMASNNTRPYVGHSDLMMANAVTDIAGLNRISKLVLSNAAHAAAGMARGHEATVSQAEASKPLVAVSMFGVTTPGVMRLRERLEDNGFEVVTFHAVGEGAGMEHLIDKGVVDGLIDFTLAELLNHWNKGIFDPGCERMEAAVRTGIPQVVVPGAVECFNFGAVDTIPPEFNTEERNVLIHNPNITSLLATTDEMRKLGAYVADHLNRAPGPKALALPLLGLDNYFKEGSQWYGVDVTPLFDSIRTTLHDDVEVLEMKNNINDHEFADAVFDLFLKQWNASKNAG